MGLGVIVGVILVATARAIQAGRAIVIFCSVLHVLLGNTLFISEPQLWVSAIGEGGLALAVLIAIAVGDRRSRRGAGRVG